MPVHAAADSLAMAREYHIQVGTLCPFVRVRIFRRDDASFQFQLSHFLKTSIQYLPYAVDCIAADDEDAAIHQLEQNMHGFYEQALHRGYTPSASWLVPNPSYH
ncbi:MAG: hypothetical protein P4M01_07420 [Acidobacteriota bacterium]|nr:hypothetical protein [Acidobacteriota bacterium]